MSDPARPSLAGAGTGARAAALVRILRGLRLETSAIRLADGFRLRRGRGGGLAFPFIRRRREPSFQILSYHRVNDEGAHFFPGVPVQQFRQQMEALARHTTVLPLGELVERMFAADLPPRSVAITFDDGYRDNYECAYPVLRALRLPATIFLTTGPLDTGEPLWHDRVFDAFEHAGDTSLTLKGRSFPMAPIAARHAALRHVLTHLRSLDPEERNRTIRGIEDQVGSKAPEDRARRMLTWEQVREMAAGGITFGAHTVSHPILTRVGLEEATAEIRDSKAAIERELGRPVDQFAYPNGTRADFNDAILRILRDQGFRCAVTTLWGINDTACDPFELKRVGLWDTEPDLIPLRLAWYRFES
jgi:peptidoglycan/xylan/chitin deacetylase (PgdA/CDA1 family)